MFFCQCQFADSGNAKGPLQSDAFIVLNMAAMKFFMMREKVCFEGFPESSFELQLCFAPVVSSSIYIMVSKASAYVGCCPGLCCICLCRSAACRANLASLAFSACASSRAS